MIESLCNWHFCDFSLCSIFWTIQQEYLQKVYFRRTCNTLSQFYLQVWYEVWYEVRHEVLIITILYNIASRNISVHHLTVFIFEYENLPKVRIFCYINKHFFYESVYLTYMIILGSLTYSYWLLTVTGGFL